MTEWGAFPLGRTDDLVDCCSLLGQLISCLVPGSAPKPTLGPPKVLSTDPATCTVTLEDMFIANERRRKHSIGRIR
jgi:hypothetical protein